MQDLNGFCIQRQVVMDEPDAKIQLHSFCDASERAYVACIYVKSIAKNKSVKVNLLCAKSRVAPIKTMSIPKLELCGAQLLTKLICKIKALLVTKVSNVYYWTNLSIIFHWLQSTKKLTVFIAHRVGEIQEFTKMENWRHVNTKENSADLVSRGIAPNYEKLSYGGTSLIG